jgi:hypothetical protein
MSWLLLWAMRLHYSGDPLRSQVEGISKSFHVCWEGWVCIQSHSSSNWETRGHFLYLACCRISIKILGERNLQQRRQSLLTWRAESLLQNCLPGTRGIQVGWSIGQNLREGRTDSRLVIERDESGQVESNGEYWTCATAEFKPYPEALWSKKLIVIFRGSARQTKYVR